MTNPIENQEQLIEKLCDRFNFMNWHAVDPKLLWSEWQNQIEDGTSYEMALWLMQDFVLANGYIQGDDIQL